MDSTVKDVFVRRMRADDAGEISLIYESITKEPAGADFRKLVEEYGSNDKETACFVAEQDGRIVGFMISYTLPFGFGIERSAWIATMGVDPRCMGQGIGGRLAQEIMSFYKSQGIAYLHTSVRWDSTDLLSFFKTLGFDRSNFINLQKSLQ